MFSITNLDNFDYFSNSHRIISVFLTTNFEKGAAEWLFEQWKELHVEARNLWYLLAPTITPIADDITKANNNNLNETLAASIISMYNIDRNFAPCIVFDDFNVGKHQHYVSLRGLQDSELRDFAYDCADIIARHERTVHLTKSAQWRASVIGDIYNHTRSARYGKRLMSLTPMVGSVARFMNGHPHS